MALKSQSCAGPRGGRAAHQALALATFALIVVHGLTLLLDPVLRPGLAGVLVPFASGSSRSAPGSARSPPTGCSPSA